MAEAYKRKPSAEPSGATLRENLALALRDEAARRSFRIRMTVGGALPAQSYSLHFSMTGTGETQCRFECRLTKRRGAAEKANLPAKEVLALLKSIQGALELPHEQPRFLPDTLVGILEISDGANVRRFYFAADPEQAKTQGKLAPDALARAANAIYATVAKLVGQRSVKP